MSLTTDYIKEKFSNLLPENCNTDKRRFEIEKIDIDKIYEIINNNISNGNGQFSINFWNYNISLEGIDFIITQMKLNGWNVDVYKGRWAKEIEVIFKINN
ncbi:MAG: hypothetical protein KC589_02675 [Nanoarchaeota archaeon]|nr:hypothetical protein [Nanoarchaeota archaeon]